MGTAELLVELARRAVKKYSLEKLVIDPGEEIPREILERRAGVFVTLKKNSRLRGCIGTYHPTQENLPKEVVKNAIGAAFRDPRFPPVKPAELELLEFTVSVLESPQPVEDISRLDPEEYGLIAEKSGKRGLLLPGIEGIETVEQQQRAVHRKAGLPPAAEGVDYKRFAVEKYSDR